MKITKTSIEWGKWVEADGSASYLYFFYWWNWLPKHLRYWGFEQYFYDHPINSFGFWFINWTWFTQWTKDK